MFHSLRWRIIPPYIALFLLGMGGLGIYLFNTVRQASIDAWHTNLLTEARLIARQVQPVATGDNTQDLTPLAKSLATDLDVRVTFFSPDGTVTGESDAEAGLLENHVDRPEVQQALAGQEGYQVRFSPTFNTDSIYLAVPVRANNRIIAITRLAIPMTRLAPGMGSLKNTILAIILGGTLVITLSAVLLANLSFRPLHRLTRAAQNNDASQLKNIPVSGRDGEIDELSLALKMLAGRLDAQINALEAERSKLAAVLAQMTDGVIIVNAVGRVELLNPAAEAIFQVDAQKVMGHSVVEVVHYYQLVDLWRKCQETRELETTTLELSAKRLFLQGIALPLNATNPADIQAKDRPASRTPSSKARPAGPIKILLLFQDLTRLRRLETVRRDFISNFSHELRTPLASLKALVETLHEGALEDPPAARRFLTRMDAEIDTLAQLVQELLELSRIESGKVPLQRMPVTPLALLNPPVERMRLQAERAGISLTLECPPDLPTILADTERMNQVVVNLLHNAIKFTPLNGKITVAARQEAQRIIFSVQDSGVGIAPDDLPRIFERFYKADRARSGGGTGLGLSIARHMVEAHGGQIWAESTLGQGSTFYFDLPVA